MEKNVLNWIEEICDEMPQLNKTVILQIFNTNTVRVAEFEDKGVVAYVLVHGFTNLLEFQELFIYLKPKFRTLINLNRIIGFCELLAKSEKCNIIKIGSNSGYKDNLFIKYLKRRNYIEDVVKKEI